MENLPQFNTDRFPLVYEKDRPVAVMVDIETFQQLIAAVAHSQEDETVEIAWMTTLVKEIRAYRQAHPKEVMTFDTPEAALAAFDEPDE